ncbi:MAG TPA: Rieske 2Fe-2S domain-containing protein, partial [Vicinamibacterales bacterium]|nr:Rieske 2Fe-2S domain-containing protein [Vicinamibacterales bacterium]
MDADDQAKGPDLTQGVPAGRLDDGGAIVGRVGDDEVLLARVGDEFFAIGAHCTHYHGPLGEGLIVGDTVRCPWHHACFSLRTGAALRAPALDPVDCYRVVRDGQTIRVTEKIAAPTEGAAAAPSVAPPESVVIVGGGPAGLAAAQMLRREGYDGAITMISADDSPPADRPNLSKEFLA